MLMKSEQYGERMALPWLDASRYADSNGFQQDGDTFQWVWRDWLVRNLNADKPFDQLSTEMLAGDLLPNATLDQKIATAFNRNHILTGEGGNIAEEQRYVSLFDRVESTTTTWLGLTVACAQCHDHKYDPITQKDYYQWMDAFNHVKERGTPSGGPTQSGGRSRFRLDTTVVEAPSPEQAAELAKLQADFDALNKDFFVHQTKAFEAWLAKPTTDKGMLPKELEALLAPDKKRSAPETKKLREHYNKNVFAEDRKTTPAMKKLDLARVFRAGHRADVLPRGMVMSQAQPSASQTLALILLNNSRGTTREEEGAKVLRERWAGRGTRWCGFAGAGRVRGSPGEAVPVRAHRKPAAVPACARHGSRRGGC